jgi:hypothetical protein
MNESSFITLAPDFNFHFNIAHLPNIFGITVLPKGVMLIHGNYVSEI